MKHLKKKVGRDNKGEVTGLLEEAAAFALAVTVGIITAILKIDDLLDDVLECLSDADIVLR